MFLFTIFGIRLKAVFVGVKKKNSYETSKDREHPIGNEAFSLAESIWIKWQISGVDIYLNLRRYESTKTVYVKCFASNRRLMTTTVVFCLLGGSCDLIEL